MSAPLLSRARIRAGGWLAGALVAVTAVPLVVTTPGWTQEVEPPAEELPAVDCPEFAGEPAAEDEITAYQYALACDVDVEVTSLRVDERLHPVVGDVGFADDVEVSRADAEHADWFHRQLESLGGESLYYFIGYYGDYFARLADLDHGPAVANLYNLAKDHPANYVRLAAFQALFGLIDEEGVLAKAKEIHAAERDERIKEYQGYFLESYIEED